MWKDDWGCWDDSGDFYWNLTSGIVCVLESSQKQKGRTTYSDLIKLWYG